jgi:tetratricopeptide (TPR) repeat protein
MAEPVTTALALVGLGWIRTAAGAAAAGIAGNFSDRIACDVLRDVKARVAGLRSVPENYDVARAVRIAQVQALERLIRDYREVGRPEWTTEPHTKPEIFFKRSLQFCTYTVGRCRDPRVKLNLDVTESLTVAIDGILAPPVHDGPAEERSHALAALAERAVLDELLSVLGGVRLPDGFEAHFRQGACGCLRFLDLFGAYIVEQFKENEPFRALFTTSQRARIETRFGGSLERLETTTEEIKTDIKELLAIARANGAFQYAAEQGISEASVRAIVECFGGEDIGRDDLIPWIDNWIEAARRELGRQTNEGEAFEAARREAKRRFEQGRLKDASAAFMDAFAREEREEQERQEERKRRRLRLLEEAIRFDELAFDGEAAADKLRLMATVEGVSGSDALGEWLFNKASEFYQRGDQKGENGALLIAISIYRAVLQEVSRDRMLLQWTGTQNNLANALQALGDRESGTARLEEAVNAYREALEAYGAAPQEVSRDWLLLQARTQNNLGNALLKLGERESGAAQIEMLKKAKRAFRAALKELTRPRLSLEWAAVKNNLGNALSRLGEQERDTARLEQAIEAYCAALEERTRRRVPLEWAETQNNLGNALLKLGERESGIVRLRQAVAAFCAALKERTRARVPLEWAMTKNNLGSALLRLGERESRTVRLKRAVKAYRAALEEYKPEQVPLDWAMTNYNLGKALLFLGVRTQDRATLEEAREAVSGAFDVYMQAGQEHRREEFENLLAEIDEQLRRLPPSQSAPGLGGGRHRP